MITHDTVFRLLSAEYVTPAEAASMLGRHINTIRRWERAGRIDGVRIGARTHITTRSLLLLMGLDPITGELRNPGQMRLIMGGFAGND